MDNLPPDPDSVEKWRQMPQNQPSKEALPPVALGTRWILWFTVMIAILIVLSLLLQRGSV